MGPLLFIIYINDINQSTHILHSILYADDSTFSLSVEARGTDYYLSINTELDKVFQWLRANHMCLNAKKTKFILFNRNRDSQNLQLKIDDVNLERVQNFNFLGLLVNENLDWTPHISVISLKLARALGIMRRLSTFIPKHIMHTIYFSLFHSQLNYQILT